MISHHFRRIAAPPIAGLVLILAAAASSTVWGTELKAASDAERYVLAQAQKGEDADLKVKFPVDSFPSSMREVRGPFIAELLTNHAAGFKLPHGLSILHAFITEGLDLTGEEIVYDVSLYDCAIDGSVKLTDSHFSKGLRLGRIDFVYRDPPDFSGMQVDRAFDIEYSKFNRGASFEGLRIGGAFWATTCAFTKTVFFTSMRVEGIFYAANSTFSDGAFLFTDSRLSDMDLNGSTFDGAAVLFTRMDVNVISLDNVTFKPPTKIVHNQLTFKLVSPMDADKLQFLLSPYDAEFYTALETSFRTHGYTDEADKIFIAKKRAERREKCGPAVRRCDLDAWAWSMFQDLLAGYGKSLQNLLYWSLGFLIIGMFVFRREKGMRIKDEKDAPHYAGRYNAFWYSLDLFLPIIKLGEADVWTPRDDRRWANLYRKVHIIIGSLFVPIGLAAWTGIIK
jgi:hypothetical protein